MTQQAYILRISPSGVDQVEEALCSNQLIIGWSYAEGLLNETLDWFSFREIIKQEYYSQDIDYKKSGSSAGHLWRFIREMQIDDLIVVPHGSCFYVAQVNGNATFNSNLKNTDTAYRRKVSWLNDKKPIARNIARSALISRMKSQGTCTDATDLLDEIKECLSLAETDRKPTFREDLENRLVQETLIELRNGRIDSFGFEHLISDLMLKLGAIESKVVSRNQDKGADILAKFLVAGTFQQIIAIQAKHWQPHPPVDSSVVDQLIAGIEAESAHLGMVVTSGSISDSAVLRAANYFDEKGIRIELVDGEQFSKLIVEHGLGES